MQRGLVTSFGPFVVALLVACFSLAERGPAQCANEWAPTEGPHGPAPLQGTNGTVFASTLWDPDGAGPATQLVVVGGRFTLAGSVPVHNIAAYDPLTGVWSAMGGGLDGGASVAVRALIAQPNGSLVAAGQFTTGSGIFLVNNIARWDGTHWLPVGGGTPGLVIALAALPNGDLVAGGFFPAGLVRWNGSVWVPFGSPNASVRSLVTMPNGDLVVGGDFSLIGGVLAERVARWNGSSWFAMGVGSLTSVLALVATPTGTVIASGAWFGGLTGIEYIAEWDGVTWHPIAPGESSRTFSFALLPGGDVIAGLGSGPTDGVTNCLLRRVGTTWVPLSISLGSVYSLVVMPGGSVVAGGWFGPTQFLRTVNDVPLGLGINDRVAAALTAPDGTLVVGGKFTSIDGEPMARIATRAVADWCPLGTGMDGDVHALARAASGELLAGGDFLSAGGVLVNHVARWNGTAWSPLASGLDGSVRCIAVMPGGDVVVGGRFTTAGGVAVNNIARWNGVAWAAVGGGLVGGPAAIVNALAVLPNGTLVAAGSFASAGGGAASNIAQWNGASWAPLGLGTNAEVRALVALPNGGLAAGGWFTTAGGVSAKQVARWNGTAWSALGAGMTPQYVSALAVLPDGDLVAAGSFAFAGSVNALNIARWDGAAWSAFGSGIEGAVACLACANDGSLTVGGAFTAAGVWIARNLAALTTTCPASSVSTGTGCPGSGGASILAPVTLPWVESTFHSCGSGLPANALVVTATSFDSIAPGALPLSTLFPQAGVGCDLLVEGDILQVYAASAGSVQAQLFLPPLPPLVGATFHQQMIPLEFDAQGALLSVTATNALQLTVGEF